MVFMTSCRRQSGVEHLMSLTEGWLYSTISTMLAWPKCVWSTGGMKLVLLQEAVQLNTLVFSHEFERATTFEGGFELAT